MERSPYLDSEPPKKDSASRRIPRGRRPRCQVCQEPFDTLLFAVSVKQGKAHPLCAALKAIGLEKLATTSGR